MSVSDSHMRGLLWPIDKGVYLKCKDAFNRAKEILVFSDALIDMLHSRKICIDDFDDHKRFVSLCFFRMTSLGISLWLIASAGLYLDAASLLRSIVEISIKLNYVQKHDLTKKRQLSAEFFQYQYLQFLEDSHVALEIAKSKGNSNEIEEIMFNIENLEIKIGSRKRRDYWPGKSIEELAKSLDYPGYYKTVFGRHSKGIHLSPENLCEYFDFTKNAWGIFAKAEKLKEILITFYDSYLHVLEAMNETFFDQPIEKLKDFSRILDGFMAK